MQLTMVEFNITCKLVFLCIFIACFNIIEIESFNKFTSVLSCNRNLYHSQLRHQIFNPNRLRMISGVDKEYQEFLAGPIGKPWKGSRSALARKFQVPLSEYSPQDVVR